MNPPSLTLPAYASGPWYVSEALKRGFCIRSARGGYLAWVATGSDRRDAANAQLMAAAPRLLEYCKVLLSDVSRVIEHPDIGRVWDWRITESNLIAAIAEAQGDPSYARRPSAAAAMS